MVVISQDDRRDLREAMVPSDPDSLSKYLHEIGLPLKRVGMEALIVITARLCRPLDHELGLGMSDGKPVFLWHIKDIAIVGVKH